MQTSMRDASETKALSYSSIVWGRSQCVQARCRFPAATKPCQLTAQGLASFSIKVWSRLSSGRSLRVTQLREEDTIRKNEEKRNNDVKQKNARRLTTRNRRLDDDK